MNIIQIGCNNGSDDVFSFIKENELDIQNALLIDANPVALEQAKEKYKNAFCNIEFQNLAIIPIDMGSSKIKLYAPVKDEISGFSSVNRKHVVAHAHSEELLEYEVPTKSLEKTIFDFVVKINAIKYTDIDHKPLLVDWLFIDTEGLDALNLLSVDFDMSPVENIIFEYIHTDGVVKYSKRLDTLCFFLQKYNFKISKDPNCPYNLIAKRKINSLKIL